MSRGLERAWERDGAVSAVLAPLSWLFGAAVGARNAAYDRGVLASHALGLPTVSVGNLSVGGTGKTPVAGWVARELQARGERPAVLLRGHGGDETLVHEATLPGVAVMADPDRVAAAVRAKALGATVLVLDDGFQHRRARRDVDLVLVAAEQGTARRLLPAGPLREGRSALRRASALVITRKSASLADAEAVALAWGQGQVPTAVMHLAPGALVRGDASLGEASRPGGAPPVVPTLAGRRVLAVSAIGNPAAFEAQLRAEGADVAAARFPDHHAFSAHDVAVLAERAAASDLVVCTLKDAVKLRGQWPADAPPFWYLSQAVRVERGGEVLTDLLDSLRTSPRTR